VKRIALIWILIPCFLLRAGNISGYVVDKETGEAILGVNVMVKGSDYGAATDLNGFFIIRSLPGDSLMLTFSHIAYRELNLKAFVAARDRHIGRVELIPSAIEAEAVEVTAWRKGLIQKDLDIASMDIDPMVLAEAPQLGKDVFKLLRYSPSVTISDAFSPQYYVRGSDPGENLVQLDGMTIYNPQHFMASEAIFNPYAIKNIEMLVGGFDARFGGRNASILNISSREGHQSEIHGEFKPSTAGIVGAVEFPVHKDATAMLSGRLLSDLTFRVLTGSPNVMGDVNALYHVKLGPTRLRFSAFGARDYMDYNVGNLFVYFPDSIFNSIEEGFVTDTRNAALGLRTYTNLSPNMLLETHVYYSGSSIDNKTYFGLQLDDDSEGTDLGIDFRTRIRNEIGDVTAKGELSYFTFWNQTMNVGCEANRLRFYNRLGLDDGDGNVTEQHTTLQAFYLQDKFEWNRLLFKIGLRESRFADNRQWRAEPRTSIAYRFKKMTVKAAYGKYHQYITTMDSRNSEFVQFLDYYNSLEKHEPLTSVHYILGVEGHLRDRLEYSATLYYKDLPVLYRYDYETSGDVFAGDRELEKGSGETYGAEFLLRGEWGHLSGWLCYSYSHGTRRFPSIMQGRDFLFDGDQPHSLKALVFCKLTASITASSTFQFTSGYPRTWETGMLAQFSYDPVTNTAYAYPTNITPQKNNVRYPPRLVWDIGWKKKLRDGFGYRLAEYLGTDEAYMTMTIRNLLFLHRDPHWYFYFPEYGYYALDMEILPQISFGYSIKF